MGGVEAELASATAGRGVRIATPFLTYDINRRGEGPDLDAAVGGDMVKVRPLQLLGALRVGVVEHPLVVGVRQVGVVAVVRHRFFADDRDLVGEVLIDVEALAV